MKVPDFFFPRRKPRKFALRILVLVDFLQNRAFSFVLHKLCVQNLTSDCHVTLPLLPPSGFSVQQLWTIIICVFGLFIH